MLCMPQFAPKIDQIRVLACNLMEHFQHGARLYERQAFHTTRIDLTWTRRVFLEGPLIATADIVE